jgi:hypothetical protein
LCSSSLAVMTAYLIPFFDFMNHDLVGSHTGVGIDDSTGTEEVFEVVKVASRAYAKVTTCSSPSGCVLYQFHVCNRQWCERVSVNLTTPNMTRRSLQCYRPGCNGTLPVLHALPVASLAPPYMLCYVCSVIACRARKCGRRIRQRDQRTPVVCICTTTGASRSDKLAVIATSFDSSGPDHRQ